MSVEILSTAAQLYEKSHLKKLAVNEWPWRSLKVIGIVAIPWAIGHFLLAVCSNNYFILHSFWYITTITVYVTARDLQKFFIFEKTVEITSHVRFLIHVQHIVDNTYYISWSMGVRKISSSKN